MLWYRQCYKFSKTVQDLPFLNVILIGSSISLISASKMPKAIVYAWPFTTKGDCKDRLLPSLENTSQFEDTLHTIPEYLNN